MPEAAEAALFIRSMKRSSAGGWVLIFSILILLLYVDCREGNMDYHGYLLSNFPFWPGSPALAVGVGRLKAGLANAGVGAAPAGGRGVARPRPVAQGRVTLNQMPRKLSPMPRELVFGLGISFALSEFQMSQGKVDFDLASRDAFELPC